jgi:hypothetical protein
MKIISVLVYFIYSERCFRLVNSSCTMVVQIILDENYFCFSLHLIGNRNVLVVFLVLLGFLVDRFAIIDKE